MTRKCDALREKVGNLERELATLRDVPKANEKQIEELEGQVDSNAKLLLILRRS